MEFLERFASENNFNSCFQTSAKEGTNIEETFSHMI